MKSKGILIFVCGCMYSGKTEELLRRVRRAEYAKQKVQIFKSHRDTRYSTESIQSHSGLYQRAIRVPASTDNIGRTSSYELRKLIEPNIDLIAIDEVQFFDDGIVQLCEDLANSNRQVIIAGLTLNFRGEPFGNHILALLAKADVLYKLTAICVVCGESATRTQRIIKGQPAKWNDPIYLEGGEDMYQAVCRLHHRIDKPLSNDENNEYQILLHP